MVKSDVKSAINNQSKTTVLRECGVALKEIALYMGKIWQSLELLAFLASAGLLIWCGGRIFTSAGFKDITEAVILGLAAILFARLGWAIPQSAVKEFVEKSIIKR